MMYHKLIFVKITRDMLTYLKKKNRKKNHMNTVFPFACGRIDDAEQFVISNRFRVQIVIDRFPFDVLISPKQRFPNFGFPGARVSDYEHGVTDFQKLFQLYDLLSHETRRCVITTLSAHQNTRPAGPILLV